MKKLMNWLILIGGVLIFSSCSPVSMSSFGDRSSAELQSGQRLLDNSVRVYMNSISQLESDNHKILGKISELQDSVPQARGVFYRQLDQNDSLIRVYKLKISALRASNDQAVKYFMERRSDNRVFLQGRNPYEVAEAYSVVKYMNKNKQGDSNTRTLKGAVANETYGSNIRIVVTGPTGFHREFILGPRQESIVFYLPIPGIYTACAYTPFGDQACISKKVGPNRKYYDKKGQEFDFFAAKLR